MKFSLLISTLMFFVVTVILTLLTDFEGAMGGAFMVALLTYVFTYYVWLDRGAENE